MTVGKRSETSTPTDDDGLTAPCGCSWTPGIGLPTFECEQHRDDESFAHGTTSPTPFPAPQPLPNQCQLCGLIYAHARWCSKRDKP